MKRIKDKALIVFVKNPVLGKAKTRLAKTIGDADALAAYLELLEHTRTIVRTCDATKFLFYSTFIDNKDAWSNEKFEKRVQTGADLGERMKNAFATLFKENYQKIAIIGSDCGDLNTEIIEQAFKELEQNDLVIGPAEDGGYYLLGMNQFFPFLFENKEWSTAGLFEKTMEDVEKQGLRCVKLPILNDVDEYEDWIRWQKKRQEINDE